MHPHSEYHMLIKEDLDRRVAMATGLPRKKVAVITRAFISELSNALAHEGGFQLDGLGKLYPHVEMSQGGAVNRPRTQTRIKLYFKKSVTLKDRLERQFGLKESSYDQEPK